MAALVHPNPTHRSTARPRPARRSTSRPARHLHVVPAPSQRSGLSADPLSVLGMVGVILALIVVVLVRGVQGAPPAENWATLSPATAVAESSTAVGGDTMATVTVTDDDTWATIAERVAPGADPVEVARRIASDNGGYQLRPGQVLVVSAAG